MDDRGINKINLKSNISLICFFGLLILYFLQGSLYPSGSIISQVLLVLFLIFNCFYLIKVLLIKNNFLFIYIWLFFIFVILLGFLFSGDLLDILFINQLKNILFFMTSFFPIYYLTRKGIINEKVLRKFWLIFFPVIVFNFFTSELITKLNENVDNVVNNASYMFVSLIPGLFLFQRKYFVQIVSFVILAFLIIGSKRGALIIGCISLLILLYYSFRHIRGYNVISKIKNILILFFIISIGVYSLSEIIESNFFVFERIKENNSTRPENYFALFNNWFNSTSLLKLVFGFGYFSSPLYTPERVMAHNDWLEMLNDFGLFGFALYGLMLFSFSILLRYQISNELWYMHLLIIFIWIFISLFSMWFNNYSNVVYSIIMGFLVGNISNNRAFSK